MAQGKPFAAYYFEKEDDRVFSLCSTEDRLGVSEIVKAYGGGATLTPLVSRSQETTNWANPDVYIISPLGDDLPAQWEPRLAWRRQAKGA